MDVNKQTKRFSSLEELEAFLAKYPEMKTGFLNVDFEKNEDPDPVATDAMHEEVEQIYKELDAIRERHPNLKSFHVDFQYGDKNEEEEEGIKPPFPYDKYFSTEKDEAYNYKEFHEHFWKEVRKHGGLPNVLKTVDYIAYDRVNGEIEDFKKFFAALLHDMANKIKEM